MMRRDAHRGQALAEFAIVLPIFLLLILGVVDFGRAIYQYNGVSQAAREIARVTSVHRGSACPTACTSPETSAVVATQKSLIPNLGDPSYTCIDALGAVKPSAGCKPGDSVRIAIAAPYSPLTPLLGLITGARPPCTGQAFVCLQASSTVKIQ
jgi:hypothetical protein